MLLAAHNRATYQLVFDAIFPRHTATLTAALAVWWDVPAVTTSVLKCLDELCYNRGLRIAFGASSAAGILLFREASAAIVAYGSRVATLRPTPHEAYAAKYKGVSAALSIFSHCLDGGYVNFGVFSLYGDPALSSAFETVLKLMLAVPVDEVMVRAGVEKPLGAAAGARARALAAITTDAARRRRRRRHRRRRRSPPSRPLARTAGAPQVQPDLAGLPLQRLPQPHGHPRRARHAVAAADRADADDVARLAGARGLEPGLVRARLFRHLLRP